MEHALPNPSDGVARLTFRGRCTALRAGLVQVVRHALSERASREASARRFDVDARTLDDLGVSRAQFLGAWTSRGKAAKRNVPASGGVE